MSGVCVGDSKLLYVCVLRHGWGYSRSAVAVQSQYSTISSTVAVQSSTIIFEIMKYSKRVIVRVLTGILRDIILRQYAPDQS